MLCGGPSGSTDSGAEPLPLSSSHWGRKAACVPSIATSTGDLRELCNEFGVLLIFDEVVTGFRVGMGGAQGYFGVKPDITVLGNA